MAELSEEERLVLGLPLDGNGGAGEVPRALLSDGETVSVGPPAAEYHPRLLAPVEDDTIDSDEQFFWELNGVSRHAHFCRAVVPRFRRHPAGRLSAPRCCCSTWCCGG